MTRLKMITVSAVLLLGLLARGEVPLFPPPPGQRLATQQALAAGRSALVAGNPEAAYRYALMARAEMEAEEEWNRLTATILIALDRPTEAIRYLARVEGERERVELLLGRRAGSGPAASLLPLNQRWPRLSKDGLKEVEAVIPARDGTLWLMVEDRLVQVSARGEQMGFTTLQGASDLTLDVDGDILAVGSSHMFRKGRIVRLPAGIRRGVSITETLQGRMIVLDETPALHRIDPEGKVEGRRTLSLSRPLRVRADGSGRLFLVDRSKDTVEVFSAALVPLRTVDLSDMEVSFRRPENLYVDFAGNFLIHDGSRREIHVFTAQGTRLASSRKENVRIDAVGWDGLHGLLFLDRKNGYVGRIQW